MGIEDKISYPDKSTCGHNDNNYCYLNLFYCTHDNNDPLGEKRCFILIPRTGEELKDYMDGVNCPMCLEKSCNNCDIYADFKPK